MSDIAALLRALDTRLFLLVNQSLRNPLFDIVMPVLSDKRSLVLPVLLALALLWRRGDRSAWLLVAAAGIAVGLSDLGADLFKGIAQRIRPCQAIAAIHLLAGCTRSFSMPSNHASNMFALAGVVWASRWRWRWTLLVLAAGVGYSRVYLGVHYPGNVLAGALFGGLLGWGIARLGLRAARPWLAQLPQSRPTDPPPHAGT